MYQFPEHWITQLGKRIKNVHLKEFTKKGTDSSLEAFRPLLDGTTNWPAVLEAFDTDRLQGLPDVRVLPPVPALPRGADLPDRRLARPDAGAEGVSNDSWRSDLIVPHITNCTGSLSEVRSTSMGLFGWLFGSNTLPAPMSEPDKAEPHRKRGRRISLRVSTSRQSRSSVRYSFITQTIPTCGKRSRRAFGHSGMRPARQVKRKKRRRLSHRLPRTGLSSSRGSYRCTGKAN